MSTTTDNINTPTGEAGNPSADGVNTTPPVEDTRTFTQEQVNKIVSERLQKERGKADTTFAAREAELAQREFQLKAREIMESKNLPVKLLDALNATDEASLTSALATLDEHFNYSNPNAAYIPSGNGTIRRVQPGENITLPPSGHVDTGPDKDGGMRGAFGLPNK